MLQFVKDTNSFESFLLSSVMTESFLLSSIMTLRELLRPKFWANFKNNQFLSVDVMLRRMGGLEITSI